VAPEPGRTRPEAAIQTRSPNLLRRMGATQLPGHWSRGGSRSGKVGAHRHGFPAGNGSAGERDRSAGDQVEAQLFGTIQEAHPSVINRMTQDKPGVRRQCASVHSRTCAGNRIRRSQGSLDDGRQRIENGLALFDAQYSRSTGHAESSNPVANHAMAIIIAQAVRVSSYRQESSQSINRCCWTTGNPSGTRPGWETGRCRNIRGDIHP